MSVASQHIDHGFRDVFTQTRGLLVNLRTEYGKTLSQADLNSLIETIAINRDRQAFALLFKHFAPRVKTYLLRFSLADNVAEEIAQETMLVVWRKASYFDASRAGAGTWIFTIARNLRIDHQRRNYHKNIVGIDPSNEPHPPLSGEEVMLVSEREQRVREALGCLSKEQLAIVRLSFFGDKPHSEIAQELGIPLGTVKSRVRLALAHLRLLMGDA